MATRFHILIKITSSSVLNSTCPVLLVLSDKNRINNLNTTLVFNAPKNNVFHLSHQSTSVGNVDSIDFYLVSENESDSILLDCIEVVDLETKEYKYFPCKQWITNSTLQHGVIPFIIANKISDKKNCFEIIKGKDGQFYFHLRAGNREIVTQSEGYKSKASAIKGIKAIQKIIPHAVIYDLCAKKVKK